MANQQSADRTEKPTPKRKRDARKRGQIARSRDLAGAMSLAVVTMLLAWFGARMMGGLTERLAAALGQSGSGARGDLNFAMLGGVVWSDLGLVAQFAGLPALVATVVSVGVSIAQTGWAYSPEALHLNWNRLNPATGVAKFSPLQGGAELLKALIGAAAIVAVGYTLVRGLFDDAPGLAGMTPLAAARYGWDRFWGLLWRSSLTLVLLAGADFGLQYWRWISQLKMTRQEIKDEYKANEGNPEIKARVRRIQREMTRRRMLHAVKTATVVVTNPTHVAVALLYRRADMVAPVVVAKGPDLMAARIKKVAYQHGVPVVENVTLARALYKSAEVGDTIPGALFGAVAEVLAYLVRLKQLVL